MRRCGQIRSESEKMRRFLIRKSSAYVDPSDGAAAKMKKTNTRELPDVLKKNAACDVARSAMHRHPQMKAEIRDSTPNASDVRKTPNKTPRI